MVSIINLPKIKEILLTVDVLDAMNTGFIAYSNGNTVVPPVGELLFEAPKGEAHIKYGYLKNANYYVIKIASGFYGNSKFGIPSSQGMMLLFDQKTGQPVAILLDEGHLTDIRTAAAGALAAIYFAPQNIRAIGIIGTGIQAKLQLLYLKKHTSCKKVWIWGRNPAHSQSLKSELAHEYHVSIATTPAEVARHCNIIVTTTPSEVPLLFAADILPGTHITAVGSDTSLKQELESSILKKADLLIADSISQSRSRGEIYRATKASIISETHILELGTAIQNKDLQRSNDQQITVVDLTGVAVQDIMISTVVYQNYKELEK